MAFAEYGNDRAMTFPGQPLAEVKVSCLALTSLSVSFLNHFAVSDRQYSDVSNSFPGNRDQCSAPAGSAVLQELLAGVQRPLRRGLPKMAPCRSEVVQCFCIVQPGSTGLFAQFATIIVRCQWQVQVLRICVA